MGFSELYLRRARWDLQLVTRFCTICILGWLIAVCLMIVHARHFLPYGRQGDGDLFWLAVWSACGAAAAAINL